MKDFYVEKLNDVNLSEALDYVMDKIIPLIYKNIGIWNVPVKGGEKFRDFVDMDMRDHYITGMACAYRILDIRRMIDKNVKYNVDKLKRGSLIYLLHDYNKLSGDDKTMPDCKNRIAEILNKNADLENLCTELGITIDEICHGAYSTELGTSFRNIFNTDPAVPNMSFENHFSRLADSISSFYARSENRDGFPEKIYFGSEPIMDLSKVHFIEFQRNALFAIKGIMRSAIRKYINDSKDRIFIWETENRLYYFGTKIDNLYTKEIEQNFNRELSRLLNESGSKLIEMTDRTIRAPALRFISIDEDTIIDYSCKNLGEILHMPGRDISDTERPEAEEYTKRIRDLNIKNFNIDFIGKKKYRDANINNMVDVDSEFASRLFFVRLFQLKYLNSKIDIPEIREAIEKQYQKISNDFKNLIGRDEKKSVFIVPFVAADNSIDWKTVKEKILNAINSEEHADIKFEEILANTVSSFIPEIEDVPEKNKMSMINGKAAKIDAREENLYGVNHQTFSNRTLVSMKNSNGKIDIISVYENMIRKVLLRKPADAIIYGKFPAPVPVLSIYSIMESIKKSSTETALKNIGDEIVIGNMEIPPMTGEYIEIPVQSLKNDKDFIRTIRNIIDLVEKTGMHVSLVPVNMFPEMDNSIIKMNIFNEILNELEFSRITVDRLYKKDEELNLYFEMANSSNKIDKIMRDIAREPLAIFYYAVDTKKLFSEYYYNIIMELIKTRGVEMKNLEELAEIAAGIKRVYYNDSNSDKTWLIREGIEVLEKMTATTKKPLDELYDVCAGHLYAEANRKSNAYVTTENTGNFARTLIKMIKEDLHGKIPSGNVKTYLISGFEYLYLVKSMEKKGGN
ncbi:hypothetical protein [Picrophilus oshimae]|uniref:Uncharacterized protein n=1 Tax=Picrophilus torridus (strain ATCC 700027 / DSM 9790 / JCM 10055 / NBRC 100828 / KAW 2/3) TaxID=1122961 RepID=Q6L358_PICTO|nr:hypothetical protein [Picrophilus oshimae]AAT42593.1 hypothetical protein PTO0008 [Picrophilus oshimae DSM 9789]